MRSAFELERDLALHRLDLGLEKHVAVEEAFHLVEGAGLLRFERDFAERRQIAREIALHHFLTVGQPHGEAPHVVFPFRQAGIGHGPDQNPLVLEGQRQGFLDDRPRLLRVGAEHAREKADIEARAFRLLQRAVLAEAADHGGQRHGLGLRAIFLDPALGDLGPGAICGGTRGARGLQQRDGDDGGKDAAHGLLSLVQPTETAQAKFQPEAVRGNKVASTLFPEVLSVPAERGPGPPARRTRRDARRPVAGRIHART